MRKRVLLLIDFSNWVYKAAAAHSSLSSDGVFTGGLYGFMNMFGKAVRETGATQVVVCCDSKPYVRSQQYPLYKLLRKKNIDEELLRLYNESQPLVRKLLATAGVPVWSLPGYEADDLAIHAARRNVCRYFRMYAASNDSDLFQALTIHNFCVYRDGMATAVDAKRLLDKWGMTPDEFMLASALQGTHNDIEGIPGIGEKRAAKAVKDPAMLRALRASHGNVIDRNLALIKLPHPSFPMASRMPDRKTTFDARALYRYAGQYEIEVTLQMVNAFEQVSKS